jgi:hypothetical protein
MVGGVYLRHWLDVMVEGAVTYLDDETVKSAPKIPNLSSGRNNRRN